MAETSRISEPAPGVRTVTASPDGATAGDAAPDGSAAPGARAGTVPAWPAKPAAASAQATAPAAPNGCTAAEADSAPAESVGLTPQQKSRALNELFSATFDSVLRIEEHALDNRLTAGLTIAELHTIAAIEVHGRKTMSAIAARLHVTLATVTTAVNKLEKKGYVERQRNPEDRRQVLVSLTGKGRRACRVHDMFHEKMVARALSSMDDAQTDALASALHHLVDFFNEEDAIATESLKRRRSDTGKHGSVSPPSAG